MNFLKQANTAIKSAKELEKNLASVGITKDKFLGKKQPTPAGTPGVEAYGNQPNNAYGNAPGNAPSNGYENAPNNVYGQQPVPQVNNYGHSPNSYGGSPANAYGPPPSDSHGAPSQLNNWGPPASGNYGQPPHGVTTASYAPPPSGTYFDPSSGAHGGPPVDTSNSAVSPGSKDVPPHIRQSYEARKPEFEALLAAIKEQAWVSALDAAAKNTHADHKAAKTASPDYVLDALNRLQEHIRAFEK